MPADDRLKGKAAEGQQPAEKPARAPRRTAKAPAAEEGQQPAAAKETATPAAVEKAARPQQAGGQQRQQQRGGGRPGGEGRRRDGGAAEGPPPFSPGYTSRLRARYNEIVVPALKEEFKYSNVMQLPKPQRVIINVGVGEAKDNTKALESVQHELTSIAGQKPVVTKARKSIANFKLREGMAIGAMVTLRGDRMWDFLDRLMNVALPRTRDFRGVSPKGFDGRGNFSLGLREQVIFLEVDYDTIDKVHGMQVNVVTTARTDQEGRRLLELLGMPFSRPGE